MQAKPPDLLGRLRIFERGNKLQPDHAYGSPLRRWSKRRPLCDQPARVPSRTHPEALPD